MGARFSVRKHTQGSTDRMSDEDQSKPAPALGPKVMAAIGQEMRRMYADIIAEGVPERLAEILRRLDEPTSEREAR